MRINSGLLLVLLLSVFLLTDIQAADADTRLYTGIKLSYFELADSRIEDEAFDDPDNVGLQIGVEKSKAWGYIGAEAEFTRTFLKGIYEGREVSADTYGLFLLLRTRESMRGNRIGPYFKIKAGPLFYHVREEGEASETEASAAAGFAFGVNMRLVRFELEILAPQKDFGFVSLNIVF